jgi:hypothetical protein
MPRESQAQGRPSARAPLAATPKQLAARAFEQLAWSLIGLRDEVASSFISSAHCLKPRTIHYVDASEGQIVVFIPTGISKRTGVPRYHAIAAAVRERYDQLTWLRDIAALDMRIQDLEAKLIERGVKTGEVEGKTFITVAPRGYVRGGRRLPSRAFALSYISDNPLAIVERIMKNLRSWLDKRIRGLAAALELYEESVSFSTRGLASLLYSIIEEKLDWVSQGLKVTIRALKVFWEAVDKRLLGAGVLKVMREKLELIASSFRSYADAMSSLFPTFTSRLARWAWRDAEGFARWLGEAFKYC